MQHLINVEPLWLSFSYHGTYLTWHFQFSKFFHQVWEKTCFSNSNLSWLQVSWRITRFSRFAWIPWPLRNSESLDILSKMHCVVRLKQNERYKVCIPEMVCCCFAAWTLYSHRGNNELQIKKFLQENVRAAVCHLKLNRSWMMHEHTEHTNKTFKIFFFNSQVNIQIR